MHISKLAIPLVMLGSASLAAGGISAIFQRSPSMVAMFDWLGEAIPLITPSGAGGALAFAIGFILQLLILNVWHSLFRERLFTYLLVGLVLSGISAITSTTTFVFLQREGDIRSNLHHAAVAPAVISLRVSSRSVAEVSDTMQALAVEAQRLRHIEQEQGGTCSDVDTRPGPGPRMRLRLRHVELFGRLAERLAAFSQEYLADSLNIGTLSTEEARALYNQAVLFAHSTEPRDLLAELAAARVDLTDDFLDAQSGERFTCQTPDFATRVARVEADFRAALDLPPHPVRSTSPRLGDAFSTVLADVKAWWSGQPSDTLTFGRNALLAAFLVEALQVMLIRAQYRHLERTGRLRTRYEDFLEADQPIGPRTGKLAPLIREVLANQTLRSRGRLWLVTSSGRQTEAEAAATHLFNLDKRRRNRALFDVPLAQLYPEWVAARCHRFGGDTFDLYPLPGHVTSWLRRVWRVTLDQEQAQETGHPQAPDPSL